jgi:hypothetical protein
MSARVGKTVGSAMAFLQSLLDKPAAEMKVAEVVQALTLIGQTNAGKSQPGRNVLLRSIFSPDVIEASKSQEAKGGDWLEIVSRVVQKLLPKEAVSVKEAKNELDTTEMVDLFSALVRVAVEGVAYLWLALH